MECVVSGGGGVVGKTEGVARTTPSLTLPFFQIFGQSHSGRVAGCTMTTSNRLLQIVVVAAVVQVFVWSCG